MSARAELRRRSRRFASTRERDRWLDAEHPKRRATETPGLYVLPGGRMLGVHVLEVTVYE